MKKLLFIILAVILVLNNTSCNTKPDEIVIGLNYEGSGTLAPYGKALLWGAELAVEEINASGGIGGQMVRLEKADNRSIGAESASAVLYLSSVKGADVIIGPATSTLAKAALSARAEVLIISPSATSDELTKPSPRGVPLIGEMSAKQTKGSPSPARERGPLVVDEVEAKSHTTLYLTNALRSTPHPSAEPTPSPQGEGRFLRLCFSDSAQGSAMGEYANERGFRKSAVIVDMSSDYSVGCAAAFRESFSGEIVFEGCFLSGETDFSALVTELSKTDFDCVYLPAYYTEAGLFIRQSRDQGITKTFLGGDAMDSPYLADVIGKTEYLHDIIYTDHFSQTDENFKTFAQKFFDRYGENPPAYSALAYDSVMLYCETLQKIGVENIQNVENVLFNTNSFQGVTGEITIKENGDCEKEPVFVSLLD